MSDNLISHPQQYHGLLAVGHPSMNSTQRTTYISSAFPTLFLTGAADFVAPWPNAVTTSNYFKHLLTYDGQFTWHPRFCYFELNTEVRWRALQVGWIYIGQHLHDARLSVEELRDICWMWGGSLFKLCAPLCSQPTRNMTILVQATELTHCHGWHPNPLYSLPTVQLTYNGQN